MYVFLDAQIWLDLYHYSNDDLNQFSKLHDMVGTDVQLILTEQIIDEVNRNRENKIKDALSQFKTISIKVPNICKGYDSYQTLQETIKSLTRIHKELLKNIETDIVTGELHADKVMQKIFDKVEIIKRTEEIINEAVLRYNIGNPPGKDKSFGDAINWETLLQVVPDNEDLFFVSSDKDYRSVIDDSSMKKFLLDEWKKAKGSSIYFYTSLTAFLNEHIKVIDLKAENLKNSTIEILRSSGSFAKTHTVIAKLSLYASWTEEQIIELLRIADDNSQVYGIIQDDDVKEFYKQIIKGKESKLLEDETLHWILEKLGVERVE